MLGVVNGKPRGNDDLFAQTYSFTYVLDTRMVSHVWLHLCSCASTVIKVLEEVMANLRSDVSKRTFDRSLYQAKEELRKLHEDY